jgi:hypothetical protein
MHNILSLHGGRRRAKITVTVARKSRMGVSSPPNVHSRTEGGNNRMSANTCKWSCPLYRYQTSRVERNKRMKEMILLLRTVFPVTKNNAAESTACRGEVIALIGSPIL